MPRLIDADVYREQLWELCEEIFANKPTNYEFNTMLDLIDNQPTVGGWIPCDERLPEKTGWYIVQYPKDCPTKAMSVTYFYKGDDHFQGIHNEIEAWRQLPEPYKEVEKIEGD